MRRILVTVLFGGVAWAQASSPAAPALAPVAQKEPESRNSSAKIEEANDLLPELPPLPEGKPTLVGGVVRNLDWVRDELTIQPFGGKPLQALFDGRTRFLREGKKISARELRVGDKIYADTVADGNSIFVQTLRLVAQPVPGESHGQIVSFDLAKSELTLTDALSSQPFKVSILPATQVMRDGQEVSTNLLQPGTLVTLQFRPTPTGAAGARKITVLAAPGAVFTFAGRVIFLDLHQGLVSLADPRDKKTYDVYFDPAAVQIAGDLQLDSMISVNAVFDGSRYNTRAIQVLASRE
ncbi:MAG: hypothetical protein JST79_18415 [Acidobacteria bacterium]|nr:hypothetical protein [Acidobacteriota bacterium]